MTAILLPVLFAANLGFVDILGGRLERNARGEVSAIHLRGAWVVDADLEAIAATPSIEKLDLSLTRVTDLGLLQLKNLPNVRELNLSYAELVTDEGLAAMRAWRRIERLNARGTKVTDNTLALLAATNKDKLRALDIGYAEVTDSGLQHLPKLTGLRELAFGGNKMTEVGLEILRSLPQLTRLDLAGKQRTDSGLWSVATTDIGLDPVATLSNLRELNLAGAAITSKGVAKLQALSKLEKLNLLGIKRVNDEAVRYLAAMPALRWVELKDTGLTAAGFAALRQARPQLAIAGDPSKEPLEPERVELENQRVRVTRFTINKPAAAAIEIDLRTSPPQFIRVELLEKKVDAFQVPDTRPTISDNWAKVVLDNESVRVSRLACPTRANCVPNEFEAVDIHVPSGESLRLRKGAPARFNETPLPLDLVRVELK